MAKAQDLVGEAGGIRIVLLDDQVAAMIKQAVQHIGGVTRIGADALGVEW